MCEKSIDKFSFPVLLMVTLFSYEVSAKDCVPAPPGLVSWWPGDGNAQDIVGGNHGTLQGDVAFAPGVVGLGFSLDGNDDFVLVSDSVDLNILGDITVDFWAQRMPMSQTAIMVTKGGSIIGGIDVPTSYGIHFFSGEQLTGGFERDDGSNVLFAGPFVTDLDFHHYAYIRRGSTHTLFLDGAIVASRTFIGTPGDTTSLPLTIGAARGDDFGDTGFTRHFAGIIDEVEVFDRALEDDEIQTIFAAKSAGKCKGLLTVDIDIKPGSDRNPINLRSKGNIPVAILSSDRFDATQVNWETVRFGPSGATERHQRVHVKDADYDGYMDVVLHFKTRDTGILCGDTETTLTGETFSGEEFTGSDVIKIIKCPKNKKNKKKK